MTSLRRIWLCADDYGMAPGVNAAIRDLLARGRLNATSVMVVGPSFNSTEAKALSDIAAAHPIAIGLHVTLTAPFQPLSPGYAPTKDGAFLSMPETFRVGMLRRLDARTLRTEIAAQLDAFTTIFGRTPDFVDGHQHSHLFPRVRDAVLHVVKEAAPDVWLRQCGRIVPMYRRLTDPKGLVLDALSRGFRRRARRHGLDANPAFAGTYDFHANKNFAALFPNFIKRLPADSVVMCHPGFVDAELERVDPVTTQREEEYRYFASDTFPEDLQAHGVTLR
jgi:predicted glycoside hydrolase/deacetylase ChbG (UPF0249 family)